MKTYLLLAVLCMICWVGKAQFIIQNRVTYNPEWILPSHFQPVNIEYITGMATSFDKQNPYTTLISIRDEHQNVYQLLVQTDFLGNLVYAGISPNLWATFYNEDKPLSGFLNCIRGVKDMFVIKESVTLLSECVIDRLNYCSD
jgi:hypothetical protein